MSEINQYYSKSHTSPADHLVALNLVGDVFQQILLDGLNSSRNEWLRCGVDRDLSHPIRRHGRSTIVKKKIGATRIGWFADRGRLLQEPERLEFSVVLGWLMYLFNLNHVKKFSEMSRSSFKEALQTTVINVELFSDKKRMYRLQLTQKVRKIRVFR